MMDDGLSEATRWRFTRVRPLASALVANNPRTETTSRRQLSVPSYAGISVLKVDPLRSAVRAAVVQRRAFRGHGRNEHGDRHFEAGHLVRVAALWRT